ncbi:hypothetical protein BN130_4103 [Cronobacter malonaticus 507]|nr:hypothetical protein BN130_4103 [Cronobacter malonaticus 507]
MQQGEEATRQAIYDAIKPPVASPFDTMSEAEFNLLSLASLARQQHPACQIVIAADRDLNGVGQTSGQRPQRPARALLPCRRCLVTGMMRLCSMAKRPRVRPFMTPSGHRRRARLTP